MHITMILRPKGGLASLYAIMFSNQMTQNLLSSVRCLHGPYLHSASLYTIASRLQSPFLTDTWIGLTG